MCGSSGAHVDGSPGAAPSAENPYWAANGGIAFPDPDGWIVMLVPRPVF
ncbi:hypothetical protein ACIA5E_11915 [Nocardia asteroides]